MEGKKLFLLLFCLAFVILNICAGLVIVRWGRPASIGYFAVLEFLNLGIAYGLTEFILALVLRPTNLPQVDRLTEEPPVAILYVTYEDVLPECVASLAAQTYSNYKVFLLDDSVDERCKQRVDEVAERFGFQVVRRAQRGGFKAGAINRWLWRFGSEYKYFAVADADSLLGNTFLEQMVRYAEHPENARVALFQSKLVAWNKADVLPRITSYMSQLTLHKMDRLINRCGYLASWGHNNLYRAQVIVQLGGFDEAFSSEDLATGLNLLNAGYECRLVDLVSYESFPTTFASYASRSAKWARQTLQLEFYKTDTACVPFVTKFHMFMNSYGYGIHLFFIFGMILLTWGGRSTATDIRYAVAVLRRPESLGFLLLLAFYVTYFFLLNLPLAIRYRVGVRRYIASTMISLFLGFYSAIPVLKGVVSAVLRKRVFAVTAKGQAAESYWMRDVRHIGYLCLLGLAVGMGLIRNPVVILLNWFWLIPFLLSPFAVCFLARKQYKSMRRTTCGKATGLSG